MHLRETNSYKGNYSQSNKYCLHCGTTLEKFIRCTRFGCRNCTEIFKLLLPKSYQPVKAIDFCKYLLDVTTIKPEIVYPIYQKSLELSYQDIIELFQMQGLYFRYRVARNLKNRMYSHKLSVTEKSFIVDRFCSIFPQKFPQNIDPLRTNSLLFPYYKIYFWDEDHLRLETKIVDRDSIHKIYSDINLNSIDNFDYIGGIGFIAACPTNCGLGNKVSIRLQTPNLLAQGLAFWKSLIPPGIQIRQHKEDIKNCSVLYYTKNISIEDESYFFRYIYMIYSLEFTNFT